jgi:uncharacterized protein YdhG (YjbR/CyaY superfamily)
VTAAAVDAYLAGVPEGPRAALEALRATIREAASDAAESISYGMPTWKHRGRAIASLGAFARHCSLFPYSRGVMERYATELEPYDTSGKGPNIRFTLRTPLPAGLVARIVATRIEEIDAGEG